MHLSACHLIPKHPSLLHVRPLPPQTPRRPVAPPTHTSSSRSSRHSTPQAISSAAAAGRSSPAAPYGPLYRLSDQLVRLAQAPGITAAAQGRALLEHLESAPAPQLHSLPTSALASLLWALVRLQLEPSAQLLGAIEQEVLAAYDGGSSSSSSGGGGGVGQQVLALRGSSSSVNESSSRNSTWQESHISQQAERSSHGGRSVDASISSSGRKGTSTPAERPAAQGGDVHSSAADVGHTERVNSHYSASSSHSNGSSSPALHQNGGASAYGHVRSAATAAQTVPAEAEAAETAASAHCRLMQCDARDLSSFIYAFNFYKSGTRSFWVAAAQAARQQLPALKPPAFVNLLTSLAATGASADATAAPVFDEVAALLLQQPRLMRLCRPRDLASIVAAYATAGHVQVALFAEISEHLLFNKGQLLLNCRATDLVSIAWAYTHMQHTAFPLLRRVALTLPAKALSLEPPDAARVLWAYAASGQQTDRRMLTAVTEAVEGRMHLATPRVAASAVWSLAKLNFQAPAFVEAALDLIASCMEGGEEGWPGADGQQWEHQQQQQQWQQQQVQQDDPQHYDSSHQLSQRQQSHQTHNQQPCSSSSTTTASSTNTSILQQLFAGPAPSQHRATARDVEQAVWAAGRLRHFNGSLVAAVKRRLPALLPGMSDIGVVNVLWGFARLRFYSTGIVEVLCAEALLRLPKLSAQSLGTLAYALSSLRHYDEQLMDAIAARATAEVKELEHIDVVNVVCACAELQHRDERLFGAMCKTALRRLPDLSLRVLINILWAFALAGRFDEALFRAGFKRLNDDDGRNLHPLGLMQLFQAQVLLQDAYGNVVSPPTRLSAILQAAAELQWTRTAQQTSLSNFQEQLVAALRAMGLQPQLEVLTRDGLFSIDIAVEWRGRRMAIEADGPSHFTISRPFRAMGSTVAKRRCLQSRGYQVLSVPFYEWKRVGLQAAEAHGKASSSGRSSSNSSGRSNNGDSAGSSCAVHSSGRQSRDGNSGRSATAGRDSRGDSGSRGGGAGASGVLLLEARMQYLKAALEGAATMSPHSLRKDTGDS